MMNYNVMKQTKPFYTLLALLTACAVLTACSDDEETSPQVKTFQMTVDATKQVDVNMSRPRRALSLDGSTLNASWATTEHVYVQGTLESNGEKFWFNGSLKPMSAGTTTRLNGAVSLPDGWAISIDEAIGDPHILTLQFPRKEVDYTDQKGTLADIAANYDYAIATGVHYDIVGNHIEGTTTADFENLQAIVKFNLIDKANGTDMLNPTALTVNYDSGIIELTDIPDATYSTNGNGVLFVAIPGFSDKTVKLTATVGNDTYTFTKKDVTFTDGKYYEINVKMKKN